MEWLHSLDPLKNLIWDCLYSKGEFYLTDLKKYEEKSEKLKALAHPQRLCIVKGLMDNQCNVTKIQECLNIPQSTVSQHLAKLRSAGIIDGKRNGLEICYSVIDQEVVELIKVMFKE